MYIRKEDVQVIEKMEKEFKKPKYFEKFIEEVGRLNFSLILSKGNTHTCTYCNHSFLSNKRAKSYEVCPKCHNKYYIRGDGLQYYEEEFSVGVLDKLENELVIRVFRVWITYCNRKYSFKYREFYRKPLNGEAFVHSCYNRGMYWEKIYCYHTANKWRYAPTYIDIGAIYYPHNVKKLLENTDFKYSMLWDFLKHSKNVWLDMEYLLKRDANNPSFELLVKMKLYKLALNAKKYNVKGDFRVRFGVSKDNYNFMKKHNITSNELEVFKLLKKKNIKQIRELANTYKVNKLKKLARITNINNLQKYSKILGKDVDLDIYLDYLENAKILGFDLKCKKYLFPENLKEQHDLLASKVKENGSEHLDKAIEDRYIELKDNVYKNKLYIIRPPINREDFKSEGEQQQHCVYTNYFTKHAKGDTDIYFMRSIDEPNKSLVTIEVEDNEIVQKRKKGNKSPDASELKFLEQWERDVLRKVA